MTSIAVLILTHNEALHIERAIASVSPIASQIFVVDSCSTDNTAMLAESAGATVFHNRWINYAAQFQWGMDHCPITADWVLRLDADEIIEPDLAECISRQLPGLPDDVSGVQFDRKHIFMGRWIRHGGRHPLTLLRLFRRGRARIEQRWMDEHLMIQSGRTTHFKGGFVDHNLHDLSSFVAKHNAYATREAVDVINQRHGLFARDHDLSTDSTSGQAALKRWFKERLYNALPFQISAPLYFLYRYVFQLGFLDGREGLIYHGLQALWYRFLVGAKVLEFERALAGCATNPAKLARLREISGLQLGDHAIGVRNRETARTPIVVSP